MKTCKKICNSYITELTILVNKITYKIIQRIFKILNYKI